MNAARWQVLQPALISEAEIGQLADVLIDCVAGGASVSFMSTLSHEQAASFWREVASEAMAGRRALLLARDEHGICGTVQLNLDLPDNQPHRADVAKMLVHRRARRQGLGAALMAAAEAAARRMGRHLLVLDTVTGAEGARLYERMGWVRVGDIPGYALWPQGGYCSTTYYYRDLSAAAPAS